MAGAPPGFGDFLNQKYDLQREGVQSEAELRRAQTAAVPITTESEAALRAAQATQAQVAAAQLPLATQIEQQRAATESSEAGARSRLLGAQTQSTLRPFGQVSDPELYGAYFGFRGNNIYGGQDQNQTQGGTYEGKSVTDQPAAPGGNSFLDLIRGQYHAEGTADVSYRAGATKVPGKGSGKVDTVPAMLAPHEAVLNKGAAEHMGRDNITKLNKIGLAKMGMVGKGGKPGYAMGTPNVTPGPYITPKPANPIPGTGGTWGPPPTTGSSTGLAGQVGINRVPRLARGIARVPAPKAGGGMKAKGGMTPQAVQQALAMLSSGGAGAPMGGAMPPATAPMMGTRR